MRVRRLLLSIFMASMIGQRAHAQDESPPVPGPVARVDTARIPTDGAPARARSGYSAVDARAWEPPGTTRLVLPVATTAPELSHILAELPGSFFYDLGTPGWPHGWSPDGLAPHQFSVSINGLSFVDPITGSPRLDLIPQAFVRPIVVGGSPFGSPLNVGLNFRSYATERPLTELRFQRGGAGFQAIEAVHVQNRSARILGRAGRLQVFGGYAGRAAEGEYPGSRLRRGRHVIGRIRYSPSGWTFEVFNHHLRHRVGAHGGVLPRPGQAFESIYDRFGASVANPGARRRTVRNDLTANVVAPLLGRTMPTSVRPYWSAQTFDYVNVGDTVAVESDRIGFVLEQPLGIGAVDPVIQLHLWRDTHALNWSDTSQEDVQLHLVVRDTLSLGSLLVFAAAGVHRTGRYFPAASATAVLSQRSFSVFMHGSSGVNTPSLIHRRGFGTFVEPADERFPERVILIRGGVRGTWDALDVGITGFANRTQDAVELVSVVGDTARAMASPESFGYGGVTMDAGLRRHERRGLYLAVQPTFLTPMSAQDLHGRDAVLPRFYGQARLGGRVVLFRGDLDLDAYLEARAWSEMRSRALHQPTGLLILPVASEPLVSPSSTLGIHIEAGVREATIFLAYENFLSGTALLAGNMIVPVYPLAERHFRFGIYWPIWD